MIPSPEKIPPKFVEGAAQAAKAIKTLDRIIIATHQNPDGDAIGSVAALGYLLRELGLEFAMYLPDGGIPSYLEFVQLPGPVYSSLEALPFEPEGAIIVDCSEAKRLSPELAEKLPGCPVVNIDHHQCEQGLGTVANFIDAGAAAAAQLVAYVTMSLGLPLAGKLGLAVAAGLLTDTGQFRHSNTSGDVFALAALLEANGIHLADIAENLNHVWTLRRLNLWGSCFHRIRMAAGGRVSWCLLTKEDIRSLGIGKDDMEGFVDILREIAGVEIGVFAREQEDGVTRFSLRSKGAMNVQQIAKTLGGGGHRNAAGLTLEAPVDKAMQRVLSACEDYLTSIPSGV